MSDAAFGQPGTNMPGKPANEIIAHNLPSALKDLANRWASEGRKFYLGPENMFFHNSQKLVYLAIGDISSSPGSWFAHTPGCSVPKSLSASELDEIQYELFKDKMPRIAQLALDYRCNLHCGMCPYHGDEKDYYIKRFSGKRLSPDTQLVQARIKKIHDLGLKEIQIGANGELLLRKDWAEVCAYAANLGLSITITTNGTLFTDDNLKKLLSFKKNIGTIKISLNALSYETWEIVNGCTNRSFYDTAMKAVETLSNNYIVVFASMIASELNAHEVGDFVRYWGERHVPARITNCIANNEFFAGSSNIDNRLSPYYFCGSQNQALTIETNGQIAACCRTSFCLDDDWSTGVPQINIDEPVEDIKRKWVEALRDKAYGHICRDCTMYSLRAEQKIVENIHGYKGVIDSEVGGFYTTVKKRKPLHIKAAREMKRFIRRFQNSK